MREFRYQYREHRNSQHPHSLQGRIRGGRSNTTEQESAPELDYTCRRKYCEWNLPTHGDSVPHTFTTNTKKIERLRTFECDLHTRDCFVCIVATRKLEFFDELCQLKTSTGTKTVVKVYGTFAKIFSAGSFHRIALVIKIRRTQRSHAFRCEYPHRNYNNFTHLP